MEDRTLVALMAATIHAGRSEGTEKAVDDATAILRMIDVAGDSREAADRADLSGWNGDKGVRAVRNPRPAAEETRECIDCGKPIPSPLRLCATCFEMVKL